MERDAVVTEQRAPWWRTVLWGTLCAGASLTSVGFSELLRRDEYGWQVLLALLGLLLALGLPVLLVRRHRAPFAVTLVASAAAVVVPIGSWTALVGLGSLIGRRRGRQVRWAAAAAVAATVVSIVRDTRGATSATSLVKTVFAPADAAPGVKVVLGWWVAPLLVLLGVAIAVGAGLAVRAQRLAAVSAGQVTAARHASAELGDRLARQRERERIGREVHDVLGHRLSLLNLHAGALEAHAPDGPLGDSARLVRESAARSMADLRSLLAVLDEPLDAGPTEPDLSLVDLPQMIAETVETGVPVSSSVYVDSAERADPALARAVYRIVQEVLTNARRHAPAQPIRLEVSGGPAAGMRIDARNPYVPGAGEQGAGQGLRGMAERVELLGGQLAYGLDDRGRTFRVTVDLPWRDSGV
ncbi:two-component sensor histidine kinase [Georgenia wutianyii]|uniref:histidine kinase n=1 Tax=Georgenia wutianyii TaxID=2585135 RepID=A0ABX5VLE3_9MICO|nr:histidine kinase [Georgenia wutianyii]QDB78536.1 two-component sensor histidine kinase [Georgenia wutianyii]